MTTRRRWLAGALVAAGLGLAARPGAASGLPALIDAARGSVLPLGGFDPLASPRFAFRGTAFVVGDGRHVLTNQHVIKGAPTGTRLALQRPLANGQAEWRLLELVALDDAHDLALLRFDGEPLTPLRLAPGDDAREGLDIALIGFPIGGVLGYRPVTHRGIIASIAAITLPAANAARLTDRSVAQLRRGSFDIFQLDATAYPGHSGGPVFDVARGEVIAIVNMVLTKGGREEALRYPSGISYAIPVRFARELLAEHLR